MERLNSMGVNKFYGSELGMYCRNKNILVQKVRCGALKINDFDDLLACERILQSKQFNREFYKTYLVKLRNWKSKRYKKSLQKTNGTRNTSLKINEKRNNYSFLETINIKIILHENSSKLSAKCPLKKCILDRAISGTKIYNNLLNTKIWFSNSKIYNDLNFPCNQQLISILKLFQENHTINNYKGMLKKILDQNITNKCKTSTEVLQKQWQNITKYEINPQHLNIFFAQILIKVVPIQLFGCFKNREIITKLVSRILRSARFEPIDLKSYIGQLNIDKMLWLKSFKNDSVKWLVTIKLVKWLLLKYVIKILYKYIHVTEHPLAVGKRLYIQRFLWIRMKRSFIERNIYSKVFLLLIEDIKWDVPKCEYKLHLKNTGLRPIVKVRYTEEEKKETKLLLKFLRQLCVTHYGLTSSVAFYDKWKDIVHDRSSVKCNKLWLISCDLDNAYGSIVLDRLNSIINMLCKDLPETLKLHWIGSLDFKDRNAQIIYEKCFADLEVEIPACRIYAPIPSMSNMCSCYVMKKTLLHYIQMSIYYQKVEVENNEYRIGKGILQGTMLSNILFEIYYSYISHRRLSTFMRSGILFKYVDDILYVTENMESAIDFMKTIKKGFSKYNCKFKQSKIQTNLPYENNCVKDKIKYLGYEIDCNSLETLPYLQKAHPSYLFTLALKNRKRKDSITLFKSKLCDRSHLRLSRIILKDPTYFVQHLMFFVKKIATMHAWRTCLLINKLFRDVYVYNESIFQIIKTSNKNIAEVLLKHYTKDIEKDVNIPRKEMGKKILKSLWTGYKQVFSNDNTLREIFMSRIRGKI